MKTTLAALAIVALGLVAAPASGQEVLGSWQARGTLGSEALEGTLELSGTAQAVVASFNGRLGTRDVALVGTGRAIGGATGNVVVTASKLNIRAGASTSSPVVRVVSSGTVLEAAGTESSFTRVRLPGEPQVRFAATQFLASVGEVRGLILSLSTRPGLTGSLSGGTPEEPELLLARLSRSASYRFDGAATMGSSTGALTLEREASQPGQDRARFVLAGTTRPIDDSIVTLARVEGNKLRRVADLRTDARGEARLPATTLAGPVRALISRRAVSDAELAGLPVARTDELDAETIRGGAVVGVRYKGPTLQALHERLRTVGWQTGYGGFRWDETKHDWAIDKLDCISSALFAISYASDLGERGVFRAVPMDNMMKAKGGGSFLPKSCFANLLSLAFGTTENYERLATSGSVYKGVCAWPWNKMRWGWEGTSSCGCGLHVTPRTLKEALPGLGEMNVLSLSQAKKRPGEPMSTWSMKYEYSVLLLYRRPSDGRVFVCHSGRWKTFEEEVDNWASDSWGTAITDVRYICWKLVPGQIDPLFWLDDQGRPFTPPEIQSSPIG